MINRVDTWVFFLTTIHLVLLPRIISSSQQFLTTDSFQTLGFDSPVAWIHFVVAGLLVGLFFNSLYKVVQILTSQKNLELHLQNSLLALLYLISFVFVASIFPRLTQ